MSDQRRDDRNSELVAICTFSTEVDALLAESVLKAAGIRCITSRDDCGGQRPSLTWAQGIKLIVRSEDVQKAERVLTKEV